MADPYGMGFEPAEARGGSGMEGFLGQLPWILWERKWWLVIPIVIGLVGAIAATLLLPERFRSTAVLVVQSQQLPQDVVGNLGTEIVDRRIAIIREQVTSRPNLISLIDRHGLFAEDRNSAPLSELVERLDDAILISPTVAELPSTSRDLRTVAFEISFDYTDPQVAQAVAQDIMDRVVELDAIATSDQVSNTVSFLRSQGSDLEAQIQEVQEEIAGVAARDGAALAATPSIFSSGTATYDTQIANLQNEISSLIAQRNAVQSSAERDPIVTQAETALASARALYSEQHPDVVLAKQRLVEARQLAAANVNKQPLELIDQQIANSNRQIAQLRAARGQEQARIQSQLAAQARAPLVEQRMSELQRTLSSLNTQYEENRDRLLAAEAGERAENQQMGERLAVVEPPVVPDEPIFPDRLVIALIGLGGGLAVGIILAVGIEFLRRPIRDPGALKARTDAPVLGVIPILSDPSPTPHRWTDWLPFRLRMASGSNS